MQLTAACCGLARPSWREEKTLDFGVLLAGAGMWIYFALVDDPAEVFLEGVTQEEEML